MRAWLVCVVASGCYLQPTVFEGGTPPPPSLTDPPLADPPPAPPLEVTVGCITHEAGSRRRSPGKWWLGERRVSSDDIDRALAASPIATPALKRTLLERHALPALGITGMALTHASAVAAATWAGLDEHAGAQPLWLLAPLVGGIGLVITAIVLDVRGGGVRRHAIDAYNDAAEHENRCPPTGAPR